MLNDSRKPNASAWVIQSHKYADAAGINLNVTPHTFRRSCTSERIKGNANLYHVKELLGYESFTTLKHYTKLNIIELKKPRPLFPYPKCGKAMNIIACGIQPNSRLVNKASPVIAQTI